MTGAGDRCGAEPRGPELPGIRGARVAIVNWRDPWHPEAGGAELYAWEMARGLTRRGAAVSFLTARAPGQARRESRDGIQVIRAGGRFTVYPRVLGWLLARRRSFDVVLDCQNGIPFFTPCVLPRRVPVLCLLHHVHTAQFGVHFGWWLTRLGRLLEGPAARLAYRRHGCIAVSPSTVTAMRERLGWRGDIYLIPNGTPRPAAQNADPPPGNSQHPSGNSVAWVGRLVAHKRAGLVLPVAARLRPTGITVDVVGRGPASARLADAVEAADLAGTVRLHGFLPEADKRALVSRALLHLNTSQGEGWGLCVLEAAALGVPTVAFDVDGLRDAVRDGQTGWLVRDGERIEDTAERALQELADSRRRTEIAAECRWWAAQLDWDASAARMAALLAACVQTGTSRARYHGAWIVTWPGNDCGVLAEGPVLDLLLAPHSGATLTRRATPLERLLGRPVAESLHQQFKFSPRPGGKPELLTSRPPVTERNLITERKSDSTGPADQQFGLSPRQGGQPEPPMQSPAPARKPGVITARSGDASVAGPRDAGTDTALDAVVSRAPDDGGEQAGGPTARPGGQS